MERDEESKKEAYRLHGYIEYCNKFQCEIGICIVATHKHDVDNDDDGNEWKKSHDKKIIFGWKENLAVTGSWTK